MSWNIKAVKSNFQLFCRTSKSVWVKWLVSSNNTSQSDLLISWPRYDFYDQLRGHLLIRTVHLIRQFIDIYFLIGCRIFWSIRFISQHIEIFRSVAVFSAQFILSVSAQRFFDQLQYFCSVHSICQLICILRSVFMFSDQFILSVIPHRFFDQLPYFQICSSDQSVDLVFSISCFIFWSVHSISQLICISLSVAVFSNHFIQSVSWSVFHDQLRHFLISSFYQ